MRTNAHVLSRNAQKCAPFVPLFCTPLRVWCYVDNLYLVFHISHLVIGDWIEKNTKSEYRNPKQIRMFKIQNSKQKLTTD